MKHSLILILVILLQFATTVQAQHKLELSLESPVAMSSGMVDTDQRILFRVSLPPELTDVVIDYAKLTLKVDTTSVAPNELSLGLAVFPLTTSWSPNVSWNNGWDTPGGDYDESVGLFALTSANKGGAIEFQLVEIVQAWVDGRMENNGLILLSAAEERQTLTLQGTTGDAKLTIYYTEHQ